MPSSLTLSNRVREAVANGYVSEDEALDLAIDAESDGVVDAAERATAKASLSGKASRMSADSRELLTKTFGADLFVASGPTPVIPSEPSTPVVPAPVDPRRDLEDPALLDKHAQTGSYDWLPGTLFKDGAQAEDVVQGSIANCYMVAAFAAIAKQSPEVLENAIRDNGDGTFTVRLHATNSWGLPTGQQTEVTVDGELPVAGTSLQYGKGADRTELWVGILEKAFAQSKGGYEAIGNGGSAGTVLTALTGRKSETITLASPALSDAQVFERIQSTLARGGAVCAGTHGKDRADLYTNSGLYAWHAYTVMGTSVENGVQYVELRNPWGRSEPTGNGADDGIFKLDVASFRKFYSAAYLA